MSSGQKLTYWNIALVIGLTRMAEHLTVAVRWGEPVVGANSHVSGDALARYRFEGMPLPNIWSREDHA